MTKINNSYNNLIKSYYGSENTVKSGKKQKLVMAKSFDNGEILMQTPSTKTLSEYIVQQSITDVTMDEYVIPNASTNVAPSYIQPQRYAAAASYEYAEVIESNPYSNQATHDNRLDVLNPLSAQAINDTPFQQQQSTTNQVTYNKQPITSNQTATDDDFMADMQSIFKGEKLYDASKKSLITKNDANTQQLANQQSTTNNPQQNTKSHPTEEFKNEHAIFDKIAESMSYANAYDLGSINIDKRLSDFDQILDLQANSQKNKKTQSNINSKVENTPVSSASSVSTEDFMHDIDAMRSEMDAKKKENTTNETPE